MEVLGWEYNLLPSHTKSTLVRGHFLQVIGLINKGLGDEKNLLLYPDLVSC